MQRRTIVNITSCLLRLHSIDCLIPTAKQVYSSIDTLRSKHTLRKFSVTCCGVNEIRENWKVLQITCVGSMSSSAGVNTDAGASSEGRSTAEKDGAKNQKDAQDCITTDEKREVVEDIEMKEEKDESKKTAEIKTDKAGFPLSLEGFKYAFNEEGELRHTETGERFVFNVKEDHSYNQKRYEALGEVLNEYVYELLEKEAFLERVYLPVDSEGSEPRSFIFMSENALSNPDKLMVLIHGSGVVRAGQWARRLIINDCLDSGTQLPFIKKAQEEGYGIIVLNTNLNSYKDDGKVIPIRENEHPESHAVYVWDNFISKASAEHIAIIAHSYGGVVTTDLAIKRETEFAERVFAVAMTDSVHSLAHQMAPKSVLRFYKKNAQNWVSSKEPLDTPVRLMREDCPAVSAGHPKHENTSWSSFQSIFKYLSEKLKAVSGTKDEL